MVIAEERSGGDTISRKDAIVSVITYARPYLDLQQMILKNSRTSGMVNDVLVKNGQELAPKVADLHKKQDTVPLHHLETVMILLDKFCKDTFLIMCMTVDREKGAVVYSLQKLQAAIEEVISAKSIKDAFNPDPNLASASDRKAGWSVTLPRREVYSADAPHRPPLTVE